MKMMVEIGFMTGIHASEVVANCDSTRICSDPVVMTAIAPNTGTTTTASGVIACKEQLACKEILQVLPF